LACTPLEGRDEGERRLTILDTIAGSTWCAGKKVGALPDCGGVAQVSKPADPRRNLFASE
jgi:hypothetical protein